MNRPAHRQERYWIDHFPIGSEHMISPTFVSCKEFWIEEYRDTAKRLEKSRKLLHLWNWLILSMGVLVIPFLIVVFYYISSAYSAITTICGVIMILVCGLVINLNEKISQQITDATRKNDGDLKLAEIRTKRMVYFSNDLTMWRKLEMQNIDPRQEVLRWVQLNEIPNVVMACYDNPMFGEWGIILSFADDDSLIFFKLKYLDKF